MPQGDPLGGQRSHSSIAPVLVKETQMNPIAVLIVGGILGTIVGMGIQVLIHLIMVKRPK